MFVSTEVSLPFGCSIVLNSQTIYRTCGSGHDVVLLFFAIKDKGQLASVSAKKCTTLHSSDILLFDGYLAL
jgi:hypothetical protein